MLRRPQVSQIGSSAPSSVPYMQVSADHRRLAYAVDLTGEELYDLYVKEVETRKVTQLTNIGTASGSMAWALDNSTLFYVTLVRTCRGCSAWVIYSGAQACVAEAGPRPI